MRKRFFLLFFLPNKRNTLKDYTPSYIYPSLYYIANKTRQKMSVLHLIFRQFHFLRVASARSKARTNITKRNTIAGWDANFPGIACGKSNSTNIRHIATIPLWNQYFIHSHDIYTELLGYGIFTLSFICEFFREFRTDIFLWTLCFCKKRVNLKLTEKSIIRNRKHRKRAIIKSALFSQINFKSSKHKK